MKHAVTSTTIMLFSLGAMAHMAVGCNSRGTVGDLIGVIDQERVLDNYDRRKEEMGKLENHMAVLQQDLDQRAQEIERQRKVYDDNSPTMSDSERSAREDEIRNLYEEYQEQLKDHKGLLDTQVMLIEDSTRKVADDACAHLLAEHNLKHIEVVDNQSDFEKWKSLGAKDLTDAAIDYLNSM